MKKFHVEKVDPFGNCQNAEDVQEVLESWAMRGWFFVREVVWGKSWHDGTVVWIFERR